MTETILIKGKDDKQDINLETAGVAKEIFADGITSMSVGPSISRIVFTSNDINLEKSKMEKRREVLRLVIPTSALLQFAGLVHSHAGENRDALISGTETEKESIKQLLGNILVSKPTNQKKH